MALTPAGGLRFEIDAATRGLKNGLKQANSRIEGFSKGFRQNFGALTLAAGGFATATVLALKNVTQAASDLQETQAKFDTVFRHNRAEAEQFSSTLQESFLLSETASKKYLAAIQDTLVPMGLARDQAAKLSFETVKLAADLGSFNNLPTETVVRDIQSALVGNTETVKKYGVVLRASDIEQRALTDSGKLYAKGLTQAEKVQAAFNIIMEGSADAIGDVARTSDSYANRQKKLQAQIENFRATMGELVIGPMTTFITFMGKIIQDVNNAIKTIKEATKEFGSFGTTLKSAALQAINFGGVFDEKIAKIQNAAIAAQESAAVINQAEESQTSTLQSELANREAARLAALEAQKLKEQEEKQLKKEQEKQEKLEKEQAERQHMANLNLIRQNSEQLFTTLFNKELGKREKRQAVFNQAMGTLQKLLTDTLIKSLATRNAAEKASAVTSVAVRKPAIAAGFFQAFSPIPFIGQALALAAIAASFAFISNLVKFNKGGIVSGSGNRDSVPALLTPGEAVLPKGLTNRLLSGGGGGANITVNIMNPMVDSEQRMREMADRVGEVIMDRLFLNTRVAV